MAEYPIPIVINPERQRTNNLGSLGGLEKYRTLDLDGLTVSGTIDADVVNVINLDAGNITTGTLTGIVIQSSSGVNRIVLNNGDYLQFFRGNVLRAQLRGNSAAYLGIVQEAGNYIIKSGVGFGFLTESAIANDYFKFYTGTGNVGNISSPAGDQINLLNSADQLRVANFMNTLGRIRTQDGIGNFYWLPYAFSDQGSNIDKPIKLSRLRVSVTTTGGAGGYGAATGVNPGARFHNNDAMYFSATAWRAAGSPVPVNEYNVGINNVNAAARTFDVEVRKLNYSTPPHHTVQITILIIGHIFSLSNSY